MALKLLYITNKVEVARIAEDCGVDWIFVDLEQLGKTERQGHLDTVISRHSMEDVKKVKQVLTKSKLLVRVNPIHPDSESEIKKVIEDGADIVMLPFFKTCREAETFIRYTDGKARTCLLCETPESVKIMDDILKLKGIDYIYIGLNDLHLGYHMKFMFELLADGTVEMLCRKFNKKGIPYGFGGIARLGMGTLPAEKIIAEHFRLGSEMAILSRSFCNSEIITDQVQLETVFKSGIEEIRAHEAFLKKQNPEWMETNRMEVVKIVEEIKSNMTGK